MTTATKNRGVSQLEKHVQVALDQQLDRLSPSDNVIDCAGVTALFTQVIKDSPEAYEELVNHTASRLAHKLLHKRSKFRLDQGRLIPDDGSLIELDDGRFAALCHARKDQLLEAIARLDRKQQQARMQKEKLLEAVQDPFWTPEMTFGEAFHASSRQTRP